MGNMRFKVGDRVRIKSLDWYNKNKDEYGVVLVENGDYMFCKSDTEWCGRIVTIKEVCLNEYYEIEEDFGKYRWTDEMIEGLVEEDVDLIPKFGEFSDNEPLDIPTTTTDFVKEHGLPCPEGYIFKDENDNVINAKKIVLEKKKKEYPKTYEECCEILDIIDNRPPWHGYRSVQLKIFQKLLICRDAYWKLYGEEMGLDKPWKLSIGTPIYYIYYNKTVSTIKNDYADDIQGNVILAFPTEEMRDAFYENFKDEIEICKELL